MSVTAAGLRTKATGGAAVYVRVGLVILFTTSLAVAAGIEIERSSPRSPTTPPTPTKLFASSGAPDELFGYSVGISGDLSIVGAPSGGQIGNGTRTGTAHLYRRAGDGGWDEITQLVPSDGFVSDGFGWAVGISGETAIVASVRDDDAGPDSGSAYVFERDAGGPDGWGEVRKLTPSDGAPGDNFGFSMAIDGETAVVGAVNADIGGPFGNAGAAYVFERHSGGADAWGEVTKLVPSDSEPGDFFGISVGISGTTAVVGARGEDDPGMFSGAAYVFERNAGCGDPWCEVAKLEAPDAADSDGFGFSVAIDGDTVMVGAPGDDDDGVSSGSVYVFERDAGGRGAWGVIGKVTASDAAETKQFGYAVALGPETAIVGTPAGVGLPIYTGTAYLFSRHGGGRRAWRELKKITPPTPTFNDRFGTSVALSGSTAIVGANRDDDRGQDAGAAYVVPFVVGGKPLPAMGRRVFERRPGSLSEIGR